MSMLYLSQLDEKIKNIEKHSDINKRAEKICEVFDFLQTPNAMDFLKKSTKFHNVKEKIQQFNEDSTDISDEQVKEKFLKALDSLSRFIEEVELKDQKMIFESSV